MLLFSLSLAAVACSGSTSIATPTYVAPDDASGGDGDPSADGGSDDSSVSADAFPPPQSNSVAVVVEPSDKAAQLLAAIQGAKTSVHLTMYLMNDKRFISALIAQAVAHHEVKVVLNQKFPTGVSNTNQPTYDQLTAGGVSVVWAPAGYTLTHEKCVIIDGAEAWIMTMNLESSSSSNREYLALDTQPEDITEAEAIFQADFADQATSPTGNLVVSPMTSRPKLLALLASAKSTIDVEGEELSDPMITSALTSAKSAGLKVRVVLADNSPPASQAAAVSSLKAAGIPVVSVHSPYIHAKAIVVDGASMYIGSENFTTGSLQYNRELGIVTSTAAAVSKVASTIATDFAAGTAL